MNKYTKRFVVTLILIGVLSSPASASAGLFDWLLGEDVVAEQDNWQISFDSLYKGVTEISEYENDLSIRKDSIIGFGPQDLSSARSVRPRTYTVEVSGYSSTVDQTDDSPFITASGTTVRDGIVASNMFPIGTVIRMPKIYGSKLFVVEDRMNRRYQNNVDIWFSSREQAKQFGRKNVVIEVVAYLD